MEVATSTQLDAQQSLDPQQLNDRQLFDYCQRVGGMALKARRHFIGLLPLVERRRLYERFGSVYSVYDFAAKIGGIGREIVIEVLRLDAQLRDYPLIRKLLYRGKIGWTKIRMITHWITIDSQKEWIAKLENLSKLALATYIREMSAQHSAELQQTIVDNMQFSKSHAQLTLNNSIAESHILKKVGENKAENFPGEIFEMNESETDAPSKLKSLSYFRETMTFSVRSDLAARLRLFRQRLEKERKEIITWEEVMDEFLQLAEGETIEKSGTEKSEELRIGRDNTPVQSSAGTEKITVPATPTSASRHIPNAVKREVLKRYNGLCAFRDCAKPAEILHHTRRFALTKNLSTAQVHDPDFIKPLCKAHERIVHATLIQDEEVDPATWKLLPSADTASSRHGVDQAVMAFRKPK